MGSDPRRRQKKQERRNAKRKEKKHQLVRHQSAGLADRLADAARYPVLDCWITDSLEEQGLGQVLLSRELPNGSVAVACFLVDRFCLGVKDAFGEVLGRFSYDGKYRRRGADLSPRSVPPADARKLLEQAVAYAHGIGLAPHPDYARALALFGPVQAADSQAEFEFGKDGQPFFIAGPHDTPQFCRQILAILTNTCGAGNFHYLLPLSGPEAAALPDALRRVEPPLLGHDEEAEEEEDDAGGG
jgi:hypothetical protein